MKMISDNVIEYISGVFNSDNIEINKLAGDASDRSFYRIIFPKPLENGATTAVLMVMVEVPAESELPYMNIQRNMKKARLPVPEIYHFSQNPPIIVTEDFGDVTLAEAISGRDDVTLIYLYKNAVELMVRIQVDGTNKMDSDCIAYSLAFDVEKLMFEFNFFYENAILKYRNISPGPDDEKVIKDGFVHICETLAAADRVMTHRDYHSRNLMLDAGNRMCMVDFQDARMGPRQYDLASLLMDSYVDLSSSVVSELFDYYFKYYNEYAGVNLDRASFDDLYDYMVIQRSIKAAGSFAYLDVVKGKNRYLKYFPTVIRYARDFLKKRSELETFHSTLSKYVEEMK